jgi:dephospho-CoA kinase
MKFWGVIGGIGSGKSFVMKLFQKQDFPTLDADQVARDVVDPRSNQGRRNLQRIAQVPSLQGHSILNSEGQLDRQALRTWMSQSADNQKTLESILHPEIRKNIRAWMQKVSHEGKASRLGFIEASRMIESGLFKELEGLIFVSCPESLRLERAMRRDSKSEEEIRALMKLQLSDEENRKYATYELVNDSSPQILEERVSQLLKKLLASWLLVMAVWTCLASPTWAREAQEWFASGKSRSMGMAVSAFVDDHNALHINPAGLALIEKRSMRFPDLLNLSFSSQFSNFMNKLRNLDSGGSSSIAQQLQAFDGTASGIELQLMSAYWTKPRLGLAVNPVGVNASVRLRTPSLLFAKADLYAAAQGGITLGYAHPFYKNRLRAGVAVKPFSYRVGLSTELENKDIAEVSNNISKFFGGGWGVDLDAGLQGNLDPIPLGPSTNLELMSGLVLQNALENRYSLTLSSKLKKGAPANDRRLNFGVAARLKNPGVLEPIWSVELRDMLTEHDEFLEFLHVAFELKMRPRSFYTSSLRFHLAKTNFGGGLGLRWSIVDVEFGTYAVNLGPGPGIGRDRRYYAQGAIEF